MINVGDTFVYRGVHFNHLGNIIKPTHDDSYCPVGDISDMDEFQREIAILYAVECWFKGHAKKSSILGDNDD